jgi:hypothetical protein
MTVQAVQALCESFLREYFGPAAEADVDPRRDRRADGLRLVTLGTERAVQGELVHHLRAAGVKAVAECGIASDLARHTADIGVFDQGWRPICIIELKHFSANQGDIDELLSNMRADMRKHARGLLPLLQLGLYTEITAAFSRDFPRPYGLYRFLAAHFRGTQARTVTDQSTRIPADFGATLVAPTATHFEVPGASVEGRVGWLLKLVQPRPPDSDHRPE